MREHANPVLRTAPASSTLYDVLDLVLDKGLVVDIYAGVAIVGLQVLTIDARVAVASVDTYLRFAAAVDRLELENKHPGLAGVVGSLGAGLLGRKAGEFIDKAKDKTVKAGTEVLEKTVDVAESVVEKTVDRAAEALRPRSDR